MDGSETILRARATEKNTLLFIAIRPFCKMKGKLATSIYMLYRDGEAEMIKNIVLDMGNVLILYDPIEFANILG